MSDMENEHDLTHEECVEKFGRKDEYQECIQECARFVMKEHPDQDIDICVRVMDHQLDDERFSDTYD